MSITSWNYCGLGPSTIIRVLKGIVARAYSIVIFLLEKRCTRRKIEELSQQIGYSNCFSIKSDNFGGGLALIWDSNTGVTLRSYNTSHIDVDVSYRGSIWGFTSFYGDPRRHLRHLSWSLLRRLAVANDNP